MDPEAITSVIYNTECPWKSRLFTIEYVEKNILYICHNTFDIFKPDDDHDNNDGIFKPGEEGDQEDNIDLKHVEKGELYDCHDDFDIYNFLGAIQEKEEKNVRNIQGTERLEVNQSHSPDLLESDDPRKGGKVKTENDENNKDRNDLWTEKVLQLVMNHMCR